MDDTVRAAVAAGKIPSAVLMAADATGKIDITRSYGARSLHKPPGENPPMTPDTPLRAASFTKLLTAIMVLQAVEDGVVSLDDPVAPLLPELAAQPVMSGYDAAGEPILEPQKTPITLRHLLTHSSGAAFAVMSPDLIRYATAHGIPLDASGPTVLANFSFPLLAQPGTAWAYSPGADWAGLLLERATGSTLEDILQARIARPLNRSDMTFKLQAHPDLVAAAASMAERAPDGTVSSAPRAYFAADPPGCMGGMGVFASSAAFFAVLRSLLADDGALLTPSGRAALFAPALSPAARASLNDAPARLPGWNVHGLAPPGAPVDYALGGLVLTADAPAGGRRAGSASWMGMANMFWTLDAAAGVAVLSCFHLEPWGDAACFEAARAFEREVYAAL